MNENETNNKFNDINIVNANARSLNNKLGSLIEIFEEYDLTIAVLSETWFESGVKLVSELKELEWGENISLIAKNR